MRLDIEFRAEGPRPGGWRYTPYSGQGAPYPAIEAYNRAARDWFVQVLQPARALAIA